MNTFGDDLIRALKEALAHAKGTGPGILHAPATPCDDHKLSKLKQACRPGTFEHGKRSTRPLRDCQS